MDVQVDDIKGVSLYELQGDIEELLAFAEARSFKTAVALANLSGGIRSFPRKYKRKLTGSPTLRT